MYLIIIRVMIRKQQEIKFIHGFRCNVHLSTERNIVDAVTEIENFGGYFLKNSIFIGVK